MEAPGPGLVLALALGLLAAAIVGLGSCRKERARPAGDADAGPDLRPMAPVPGPDWGAPPPPPVERPVAAAPSAPAPSAPASAPAGPAAPRPSSPPPSTGDASYAVVAVAKGGTIRGVCRISEVVPAWDVKVFKDREKGCGGDHKTERMVVGEDRALGNCLLTLHGIREGKDWPEALRSEDRTALVDQKGCVYLPHVQWIRPETQIVVGNSDQADHNIHGFRESLENTAFNFISPPASVKADVAEANLERLGKYLVKCDIHPWMNAYVHVVANPYVALTSAAAEGGRKPGEYVLEDVPPGTYVLRCWHESLVERPRTASDGTITYEYGEDFVEERSVTVREGETATADFTVPATR